MCVPSRVSINVALMRTILPERRAFDAVDLRDVRVVERREHFRLALEAREAVVIGGELVGQDLEGDVAFQLRVTRAIHHPHAARSKPGDDGIWPDGRAGFEEQRRIIAKRSRAGGCVSAPTRGAFNASGPRSMVGNELRDVGRFGHR
jgi:hypothetical protein